jgi:hypothetical protein
MLLSTQLQVPEELIEEAKLWVEKYLQYNCRVRPLHKLHNLKDWQHVASVYSEDFYVAHDGTSIVMETWEYDSPKTHLLNCKRECAEFLHKLNRHNSYRNGKPPISKRALRFIIRHCLSNAITNRVFD